VASQILFNLLVLSLLHHHLETVAFVLLRSIILLLGQRLAKTTGVFDEGSSWDNAVSVLS